MIMPLLLFIAGLVLLVKGADYITEYASKIAKKCGISEFMIGITFVAFTTSIPEISVSIVSAASQVVSTNTPIDIASGTVIGSNIANIGLVLGLAVLSRSMLMKKTYIDEGYFMLLLSGIFAVLLFAGITWYSGVILLMVMFIFLLYVKNSRGGISKTKNFCKIISKKETVRDISISVFGAGMIVVGSILLVNSVLDISAILGIPEFMIAIIAVAVGTSLPEIATSVVAAFKKMHGISLGNIIGSNIFNIFGIALASFLVPISISHKAFLISMPIFILLPVILIFFMRTKRKITKKEGVILLVIYAVFVALQVI
ncbi:MAG: calcium/sodium antiporter [Candidatus Aenigmarchaeota archaeon]|nr:calcium/sodium antiporter [Candidatus Aenigmarchaeota archaeon]